MSTDQMRERGDATCRPHSAELVPTVSSHTTLAAEVIGRLLDVARRGDPQEIQDTKDLFVAPLLRLARYAATAFVCAAAIVLCSANGGILDLAPLLGRVSNWLIILVTGTAAVLLRTRRRLRARWQARRHRARSHRAAHRTWFARLPRRDRHPESTPPQKGDQSGQLPKPKDTPQPSPEPGDQPGGVAAEDRNHRAHRADLE